MKNNRAAPRACALATARWVFSSAVAYCARAC